MDLCMKCGTTAESSQGWPVCENGCGEMLHIGRCNGCGVELGYVIDDDMCSPEQLACGNCVKMAKRKGE